MVLPQEIDRPAKRAKLDPRQQQAAQKTQAKHGDDALKPRPVTKFHELYGPELEVRFTVSCVVKS